MNSNGKKFKEEWAFFISPVTQKIKFNAKCKACIHDCKQSFRTEIIRCPFYEKEVRKC